MLKEVKMYHETDGKINLAKNSSRAFASSEYSGKTSHTNGHKTSTAHQKNIL